ncbi:MAG: hypothetical protein JNL11_08565 [Bdellovibrionaceae bacterium]|nr:hypothetical protein [Pseudobdellovibrionaceae bacterium]
MKLTFFILSLVITSLSMANERFECRSTERNLAYLSIQGQRILWHDKSHSAISRGKYTGIEKAPYSSEKGYYVVYLLDFYQTNDSYFFIKIEPNFRQKKTFRIVHGFDNDGHDEQEEKFLCRSM